MEVHVLGQVSRPGVVTVPSDARVQDVVRAAGGLLDSADLTRVNLARHVQDGEQIVVPRPGQVVSTAADPSATTGGTAAANSPVDLNAADATALDALPGVGPVLAARIVQYREANGPFRSVDQLDEVSGIGAKLMEQLRPLVHV
ncbi:competence protein ComEA [Branchiibius sp. NY16-3462-2]|nr:competence protein ComEA [Branchiibius sp. NY16-3462-2]